VPHWHLTYLEGRTVRPDGAPPHQAVEAPTPLPVAYATYANAVRRSNPVDGSGLGERLQARVHVQGGLQGREP
jgi:hypothetical protein